MTAKTQEQEFKQAEIGEIPTEWTPKSLGDIVDFIRGIAWGKSDESPIGVPVVGIPNVKNNAVDYDIKYRINKNISEDKRLYDGDILLVSASGSVKNVGRSAQVVNPPFELMTFASFLVKANPKDANLDISYLKYALQGPFVNFTECSRKAADGKFNLQVEELKKQTLLLPQKPEQKKIAFVLSEIQKAVETQEKIVASLKELKAATMEKLFREGTRGEPLKQTEIGEIPQSWDVMPFRDTCHNFFSGGTPTTKNPEYWNGGIAWTTSAHITDMFLRIGQRNITKAGLENSASNLVPAGNLLLGTRVGVGKVAINLIDVAISQDLTGCIVKREKFISEYLAFALLTKRCQQFFSANKRGATIKGIPREDVLNLFLPIPKTKAEQQDIANILLLIEQRHGGAKNKLAYLQSLFSSTLNQLMTGKKRVNDLNIEEVLANAR